MSSIFKKIYDIAKAPLEADLTVFHHVTGTPTEAEQKRIRKSAKEQQAVFKRQSELAEQEIARKREMEATEKRRINEKQIAAMRRHFSPTSFLQSEVSEFPSTLGD